jgi:hypothetical protein
MVSDLEVKFNYYAKMWHEETDCHSNPNIIISNKYYQKLIELGNKVIPLIINELKNNGGFWFNAL